MKHKKIVFITPTMDGGGSERVMATLANELVERGVDVTVAITRSDHSVYELDKRVILEINPFGYTPMAQIRFIRRLMKRDRNSIFISFLTYQNMYTLIAGVGTKRRIIVSERNDPSTMLDGRDYLTGLRTFLYSRAEWIVFQTEDAKKYFSKKIQGKGVIIPNPIREDLPESYHGSREKYFVAYSRLDPQKNIPMMLYAFEIFRRKYSDYKLFIYGEGEEKEKLQKISKEIGLDDSVEFRGFSTHVHSEIIRATAFLSSSDYEGISNSMLEAMAIGLPCICTDCPIGGTRMFIREGWNGMMTEVRKADEMAEKMCMLVENQEKLYEISKNAASIKYYLSVDRIIEKWMEILS